MVKVFEGSVAEYRMDNFLRSNLDTAKKAVEKDWDMIFVVDGEEGTGKSVWAQQAAFYCEPGEEFCSCDWKKPTPHEGLCISRIVFNPDDFKKAVTNAHKFQVIILDEAYGGLSSRAAMSSINRSIIQMLTVIRAKNLFIFIVLPTFFDLDKYVALWRSRALINVYSPGEFERGCFSFYGKNEKKMLYVYGKKHYDYAVGRPNFRGNFGPTYCVDEQQYRLKKEATSMQEANRAHLAKAEMAMELKQRVVKNLAAGGLGLSKTKIAAILGITRQTVHAYLKESEDSQPEVVEEELLRLM